MARKIKKSIPWFLVLFLIGCAVYVGFNFKTSEIKADTASTSVEVGNVAPAFTVAPTDSSDCTSPTSSGSNVSFAATATDDNGDQWKLLICKTDGTSGTDCDGGAGDRWCVSASAVDSGDPNACTYTSTDSEFEQTWYGYACDASGCSTNSNANSPFVVNRRPVKNSFSDDSPVNPAVTVTWTANISDSDSGGSCANDTVSLYVCKANDFTGTVCGVGGTWCSITGQAPGASIQCQESAPRPDGNYAAYGFAIDNHNFAASPQGGDSVLEVNNVAPSISASSVTLYDTDESGDLNLNVEEGETLDFLVKFTVVDNNSCLNISSGNEIASAITHVRMSEKTQGQCDSDGEDNNNDCYANAHSGTDGQCVQDTSVNDCTGNTDTDVGWRCEFPLQYHADPTVTSTPKAAYNWVAAVQATDDDSASSSLVDGSNTNEMARFLSYDVDNGSASIAYGTLAPGGTSTDKTNTVEATGNIGLDNYLYSTYVNICTDFPTCSNSPPEYVIAIGQQHWDSVDDPWASMSTLTQTTTDELELNCAKTTTTGSNATANVHWKIQIPGGQAVDTYTGQNTIEGKSDNETYGGT